MATFRVGIGSFNINDGSVGIGTEGSGHGNLKVEGTIKSKNLDVLGVSTFTRYSGFSADEVNVNNRDLTLSGEYSTTGDIVVEDGASLTVGLGSTACVGSVECISVKHHFSVPVGDTAQRNETSGYGEGTVRYNRDLGTMEFFNGNEWRQFTYISDIQNSPSSRGRGVFAGGRDSGSSDRSEIDFIEIASTGNAQSFGDLATARMWVGGCGSATRGIFNSGTPTTNMDYITIASQGNGITFGTNAQKGGSGTCSSSTRGLFAGGYSGTPTAITYIQINTLGNATTFGSISRPDYNYIGGLSSPVRGVFPGGGGATPNTDIDFVTIASLGNAVHFGDMTVNRSQIGSLSNNTRGLMANGRRLNSPYITTKTIDYITIASEGNAIDFGDTTNSVAQIKNGASTATRGVFAGGTTDGSDALNRIEYVTIASTGNAQDFGDLGMGGRRNGIGGLSDSHGGLGGY